MEIYLEQYNCCKVIKIVDKIIKLIFMQQNWCLADKAIIKKLKLMPMQKTESITLT